MGIKRFKLLSEKRLICVIGNDVSENLAPKFHSEVEAMSLVTPLHLWHIFFVLLAVNGLLPAELKFRENVSDAGLCVFALLNTKRLLSFSTATFIADLFVYAFLLSIVKHSQYLYLLFLCSVKMVMEATEKSAETILTSTAFHPLVSAVSYQTALR